MKMFRSLQPRPTTITPAEAKWIGAATTAIDTAEMCVRQFRAVLEAHANGQAPLTPEATAVWLREINQQWIPEVAKQKELIASVRERMPS